MSHRRLPGQGLFPAARAVNLIFGLVFAGIGVTVLVFLWSQPFGVFGAPPLFFRVFGSFIAIAFVTVGGTSAYAAIHAANVLQTMNDWSESETDDKQDHSGSQAAYACPRCGAPLANQADVSPHGDVKCDHCGGWFNVHRQ